MSGNSHNKEQYRLPSRGFCYAYTVAMLFAQQFEVNLRALLWVIDYHGWGSELSLTEKEHQRFKIIERFIDEAALGALRCKLKESGIVLPQKAWSTMERACKHRNHLAHSFLAEQDFDIFNAGDDSRLTREIHLMTIDLYHALVMSRKLRHNAESRADQEDKTMREMMRSLGVPNWQSNPNRHYFTRKKK